MKNLDIDIKVFSEYAVNFIHDINEYNNQQDKEITPFKLQKLLYFVYAYALVVLEIKLWNDSFEKWSIGPILPEVFFHYGQYGNKQIDKTNNDIKFETLPNWERLDLDALMLEVHQKFTDFELVAIACSEPWKKTPDNAKISDQDIIDYYSQNNVNDRLLNEIIYRPSENDFSFLD
ncbi:hypothetical protein LT336_00449 [Spiroplasma sp. JKS002671]|uniref:Panacea domain-containing protein n=1 Tax=Spiroplasma attinicola TaxID=2904537 RepID=UPI002022A74D|nr:type II toxin-antitoxin system antitoxin SocA domain-containing protein [Spiroplasma sp. JKS002671]MCL8210705.1 hypothetical protein [Spiroplasma sp. JKS002671]